MLSHRGIAMYGFKTKRGEKIVRETLFDMLGVNCKIVRQGHEAICS